MEEMVFGRRYRVLEKIGSGGMADVFKAVDEVLGRTVAVKVMHPRYAAEPTFAARFRQEAQAAANLQSPYIVNMYDWGQDGSTYYIVMEYVRGTDLKSIIEQSGALDSKRVADIGAQVAAALSTAHGYDVIHRDIKPHNIMITPDGSVKVMDFGIARAGNTTMTQTGSVLGTAHYVSPEQAQGRPLAATSDLYSLGIVLYEAATGKLPFDAESPVAVALKQVNDSPLRPRDINPSIDPGLEAVILKAMQKQPSERYHTADEMRRDLLRVVQGGEVQATAVIPAAVPTPGYRADETAVMPAAGAPAAAPAAAAGRPVRRKPRLWPWLLLAALLIAGGLAAAWYGGLLGTQRAQVPDVVGLDQAAAEAAIEDAGLTVGEVTQEFNADVPSGRVISQEPAANVFADLETTVSLVVSQGPRLVDVPEIVGLSEEDARAALEEAGLTAEPLEDEYSASVAVGRIIRQSPEAGTEVEEGASVQYVESLGKRTVEVPDVRGRTRSDAESRLQNAGFRVSVTEQFSDDVRSGRVISQNPRQGTRVEEGSTVTIVVSKGPEMVEVPDVVGRSEAEARTTLEGRGFEVEVQYEPFSENGMVLSQNPAAGTDAARGSRVTILVDAQPPNED